MRVVPLRDFFVVEENYADCKSPLVQAFGEFVRKFWNPRLYRAHVSPHELLQVRCTFITIFVSDTIITTCFVRQSQKKVTASSTLVVQLIQLSFCLGFSILFTVAYLGIALVVEKRVLSLPKPSRGKFRYGPSMRKREMAMMPVSQSQSFSICLWICQHPHCSKMCTRRVLFRMCPYLFYWKNSMETQLRYPGVSYDLPIAIIIIITITIIVITDSAEWHYEKVLADSPAKVRDCSLQALHSK